MKTLHLVLKHKWYDKIASGEKTSEYRECTPYWNKRFETTRKLFPATILYIPVHYDNVVFHRGYTNETMCFKVKSIQKLQNQPNDLNLPYCWEIKLGKRLI